MGRVSTPWLAPLCPPLVACAGTLGGSEQHGSSQERAGAALPGLSQYCCLQKAERMSLTDLFQPFLNLSMKDSGLSMGQKQHFPLGELFPLPAASFEGDFCGAPSPPNPPLSVLPLLRDPCDSECHGRAWHACQPAQQRVTPSQEHLGIALRP